MTFWDCRIEVCEDVQIGCDGLRVVEVFQIASGPAESLTVDDFDTGGVNAAGG